MPGGDAGGRGRDSVEDLVESHIGLAVALARRYEGRGESLEDLRQVAALALLKAARRFDPKRGASFSTYAMATILGELKRHFRDRRWVVHVSRSAQERFLLVRDATEWATADTGRSPSLQEIAERAGVTVDAVIEGQKLARVFRPEPVEDGEAGHGPTGVVGVDPGFEQCETRADVRQVLAALSERDRLVLRLRFEDELSQAAIAARLGITQMQVSRILRGVLLRLRRDLA